MQDHQMFRGSRRTDRDAPRKDAVDTGTIDVAAWVVALLAARKSTAEPVLRPDLLAAFHAAAIEQSHDAMEAFLRDLVRQKIPAATVADLYIPALARRLGDDWLDDRVSFMEVRLASSRMQAMLRAMGAAWTADLAGPGQVAALLLVVPAQEQHTLGAMVRLGQLRRIGVSVRLTIAPDRAALRSILAEGRYQGVLASLIARTACGSACDRRRCAPRRAGWNGRGGRRVHPADRRRCEGCGRGRLCDLGLVLDACAIRCEGTGVRQRAWWSGAPGWSGGGCGWNGNQVEDGR